MKDQQLYQLIERAVRDKKAMPHHSETQNFAERYCQRQLEKKKLNSNHSKEKMNSLMKNFNKLETYFDLPELLNSISIIQRRRQNQEAFLKSTKMIELSRKPLPPEPKHKLNRQFSQMKNMRFVLQNDLIKDILNDIENDNEWTSQNVKNNSNYNLNILFQKLKQQRQQQRINLSNKQDNSQIFQMLQKYKDHQNDYHKDKQLKYKNTQLNSEEKKMKTNFLHKVSSFLQIILENQHRNKWNRRKRNTAEPKIKTFKSIGNIKDDNIKIRVSPEKRPTINLNLSNTRCIQQIRQQTKKIKEKIRCSKLSTSQTIYKQLHPHGYSRFFTETTEKTTSPPKIAHTFYMNADSEESKASKIKKDFTFRKRNVKQKIINKLNKFIGEIDEQELTNKKENKYYNSQINKLQNKFQKLFGRYKRETLANKEDIQNLKKLSQEFQINKSKTIISQIKINEDITNK